MYTNHKGAYSSHTHVHKTVPYIGAPYHGQVLCSKTLADTAEHKTISYNYSVKCDSNWTVG